MGTDISLSNVKQVVTDRIKAQFAELIPEDAWKAIIDQATTDFLKVDLPKMIKDELAAQLKERVKSALASQWDGDTGKQIAGEVVATTIKEHGHLIVNAMIGSFVQQLADQLRFQR